MDINVTIWSMDNGEITELKHNDLFFVLKQNNLEPFYKPIAKEYKHNIKISYLEKWIRNGKFEVFTLDQFFKSYPKQRNNNRLNKHIFDLVDKKIISQLGKDKFKVNREKK